MPDRGTGAFAGQKAAQPEHIRTILGKFAASGELSPDARTAIRYGLGLEHTPHECCPCAACHRALGTVP